MLKRIKSEDDTFNYKLKSIDTSVADMNTWGGLNTVIATNFGGKWDSQSKHGNIHKYLIVNKLSIYVNWGQNKEDKSTTPFEEVTFTDFDGTLITLESEEGLSTLKSSKCLTDDRWTVVRLNSDEYTLDQIQEIINVQLNRIYKDSSVNVELNENWIEEFETFNDFLYPNRDNIFTFILKCAELEYKNKKSNKNAKVSLDQNIKLVSELLIEIINYYLNLNQKINDKVNEIMKKDTEKLLKVWQEDDIENIIMKVSYAKKDQIFNQGISDQVIKHSRLLDYKLVYTDESNLEYYCSEELISYMNYINKLDKTYKDVIKELTNQKNILNDEELINMLIPTTSDNKLDQKIAKILEINKNNIMPPGFIYSSWDFANVLTIQINVLSLLISISKLFIEQKREPLNIETETVLKYFKTCYPKMIFPYDRINKSEDYKSFENKIKNISQSIKKELFFQDEQIDKAVQPIMNKIMFQMNKNKPWAAYLFGGPTGVGKTKLSQLLSEHLFDEKEIIIVNMAEYNGSSSKSLISKTGDLSTKLRTNPQSVVVFDEIEKASQSTIDNLLQILGAGYFKNSDDEYISLKNAIVICTTNLCSELEEYKVYYDYDRNAWNDLLFSSGKLRREILGRFDKIIMFNYLDDERLYQLFKFKFNKTIKELFKKIDFKFDVKLDDSINDYLSKNVDLEKKGARSIESLIDNDLLTALSNFLIHTNNIDKNLIIHYKNGKLEVAYE
ncbi:AAA family ATPase [Mycoplasma corogypsi]|uniref:AAA family ATPase n=1 Tax=Mycoplasma corogypsi TaxID=2106 RepID=UPI00387322D3